MLIYLPKITSTSQRAVVLTLWLLQSWDLFGDERNNPKDAKLELSSRAYREAYNTLAWWILDLSVESGGRVWHGDRGQLQRPYREVQYFRGWVQIDTKWNHRPEWVSVAQWPSLALVGPNSFDRHCSRTSKSGPALTGTFASESKKFRSNSGDLGNLSVRWANDGRG